MSYSQDRGKVDYEIALNSTNGSINIYALNFESRPFINYSTRIYGLLFMPTNSTGNKVNSAGGGLPGLVFLPGEELGKNRDGCWIRNCSSWLCCFIYRSERDWPNRGYYLDLQDDSKFLPMAMNQYNI